MHFEDISAANLVGDKLNPKNTNLKASEKKEEGDLENDAAEEGENNESAKSAEE